MSKILIVLFIFLSFISCEINNHPVELKIDDNFISKWEKQNLKDLTECCEFFKGSGSEIVMHRAFKKKVRNRIFKKIKNLKTNYLIEVYELYGNNLNNSIDVVINDKVVNSFSFNFLDNKILSIENPKGYVFGRNREELRNNFNDKSEPCCDIVDGSSPQIGIYSLFKIQKEGNLKLIKTTTL